MEGQKSLDLYEILGVQTSASQEDIRKAFRTLARKKHPDKQDKNKADQTSVFQEIQHAFDILQNPEARQHYDTSGLQAAERYLISLSYEKQENALIEEIQQTQQQVKTLLANADNTTFIEEVTKINQFYLELLASKPGPIQQKLKRCLAENYYQLAKLMHQQQDITNSLAFITEGLKYTQEKEEFFEKLWSLNLLCLNDLFSGQENSSQDSTRKRSFVSTKDEKETSQKKLRSENWESESTKTIEELIREEQEEKASVSSEAKKAIGLQIQLLQKRQQKGLNLQLFKQQLLTLELRQFLSLLKVLNQVDKKESLDNICWFYSNFADKLYRNNYSNDAIEVIDGALTSFPGSSVTNNLVMLKNLFKASIKKRKENLELQINELHNQLYQGTSLYTLKQDLLTKQPEFLNLLQSLKSEDKRRCIDKICPLYLTLAEKLVELSYTTEAVELIDSALAHFPDTSINDNLVRLKVHAESLNEIFDTSDLNQ